MRRRRKGEGHSSTTSSPFPHIKDDKEGNDIGRREREGGRRKREGREGRDGGGFGPPISLSLSLSPKHFQLSTRDERKEKGGLGLGNPCNSAIIFGYGHKTDQCSAGHTTTFSYLLARRWYFLLSIFRNNTTMHSRHRTSMTTHSRGPSFRLLACFACLLPVFAHINHRRRHLFDMDVEQMGPVTPPTPPSPA